MPILPRHDELAALAGPSDVVASFDDDVEAGDDDFNRWLSF